MSEAAQRPSRRRVISGVIAGVIAGGGAGLLALAGCVPGTEPDRPELDPEVSIRARIAEEVRSLSRRYAAVVAAFPEADEQLVSFAAEHDAHARALTGPSQGATPSTSSSAAPSPGPAEPAVPTELRAAIQTLVLAEHAAAARRSLQARRASPSLARLLASIAGCDAAHATLLPGPVGPS